MIVLQNYYLISQMNMTVITSVMATLSFQDIWKNYPNSDPCVNPKTSKKAYDNQCAIRIGMALEKSGVNFKTFRGPRCESGAHGNGMVLRAEELATWLRSNHLPVAPPPWSLREKDFGKNLPGARASSF